MIHEDSTQGVPKPYAGAFLGVHEGSTHGSPIQPIRAEHSWDPRRLHQHCSQTPSRRTPGIHRRATQGSPMLHNVSGTPGDPRRLHPRCYLHPTPWSGTLLKNKRAFRPRHSQNFLFIDSLFKMTPNLMQPQSTELGNDIMPERRQYEDTYQITQ